MGQCSSILQENDGPPHARRSFPIFPAAPLPSNCSILTFLCSISPDVIRSTPAQTAPAQAKRPRPGTLCCPGGAPMGAAARGARLTTGSPPRPPHNANRPGGVFFCRGAGPQREAASGGTWITRGSRRRASRWRAAAGPAGWTPAEVGWPPQSAHSSRQR